MDFSAVHAHSCSSPPAPVTRDVMMSSSSITQRKIDNNMTIKNIESQKNTIIVFKGWFWWRWQ